MQLSVFDRVLLLNILPDKGDVTTLRIIRDLQTNLGFDEEETARIGIRNVDGGVQWDAAKAELRDIPIGPRAHALIVQTLDELSKKKTLTLQQLDLYDRFTE